MISAAFWSYSAVETSVHTGLDVRNRSQNPFVEFFLSKFLIQRHSVFRSYQKSYLLLFSSLLVLRLGHIKSHLSVCSSHGDLKIHLCEFFSFRLQCWILNATQLTFSVYARKNVLLGLSYNPSSNNRHFSKLEHRIIHDGKGEL